MTYTTYFICMAFLWTAQIWAGKKLPFEFQGLFVIGSFVLGGILVVTHQ